MRIIQQAREKARAEAAASGRGRRARAPSLKALEAAGLMEEEGAQMMTRARELEEREKTKERKELWKAAIAVGLRPGQVMEAFSIQGQSDASEDKCSVGAKDQGTWRPMGAAEILSECRISVARSKGANRPHVEDDAISKDMQLVTPEGNSQIAIADTPAVQVPGIVEGTPHDREAEEPGQACEATSGPPVPAEETSGRGNTEAAPTADSTASAKGFIACEVHGGGFQGPETQLKPSRQLENCRKRAGLDDDDVVHCW